MSDDYNDNYITIHTISNDYNDNYISVHIMCDNYNYHPTYERWL